jgi:CBS domain containing-hemolysin-like protein
LLSADLFKSFVFLLIVILAFWSVPRWCAQWGWPTLPVVVLSLIGAWLLRVLCGDILPRRLARAQPGMRLLSGRLTMLGIIWRVFRPILWLGHAISHWRPVRSRPQEREEIVERAFDALADSAGLDETVIEDDEREMIKGVIGLENTEVREVMVPRVNIIAVDVRATLEDVRARTAEFGHSRLPVYDDTLDTIVGILYVKDLFCAQPTGDADWSALVRPAFVVPESKRVDALLEELKRRKTHIAIVVDEFGGTAGLVTLEDILEEIVGEIEDEHDRRHRAIEHEGENVVLVDGVVTLVDVAEALDIDLPDERFETIGGLIYDRVGGVPKPGQQIAEHGLSITIEKMDGQRIRRVRIARPPRTESERAR